MIEVNLTDLENESIKYINILMNNKGKELREEMIKFLKESYWQDSLEYGLILEFVNDFFVLGQSESSKREDLEWE